MAWVYINIYFYILELIFKNTNLLCTLLNIILSKSLNDKKIILCNIVLQCPEFTCSIYFSVFIKFLFFTFVFLFYLLL